MLIGINAQKALERETGVGNYTANLVQALAGLPETNGSLRFFLMHGRAKLAGLVDKASICSEELFLSGAATRILWEQFDLPFRASKQNVDLIHYVDHSLSIVSHRLPMIITIHDLAFFEVPTMYNTMRRFYKQSIAEYSIRRAAHVIAISEKTRADILARFKISDNKITTIAYGKSPSFKRLSAEKHVSLSKKYDLFRPFFLFVGTLQPRKNLHNLVAAFGRVRRETDLPHELVVAGEKGWLTRDVVELAGEHGVADRVRQLGAVPHADMAALYNCAEALVYPSWYEGFGLPPLEAMACGTPVIASRAASLPEVVGDAGILVDPSDVPGLADAMCRIVRDKALREDLIRRGLARAEMYSWEKCARETFTVYRRVYEQTKRHAPV